MKKYAIIFGKDPEEFDEWCWPDMYEDTQEFNDKFVAGRFETDEADMFWQMFITINFHPCSMWYWIIINGYMSLSGAIDPCDIDAFEDDMPDYFKEQYKWMYNAWDDRIYAESYNKYIENQHLMEE